MTSDDIHFIRYTGLDLDRAGEMRKNQTWLDERLARPETRIVPVWRNLNLIDGISGDGVVDNPRAILVAGDDAGNILEQAAEITFLGLRGDRAVFGADMSHHGEGDAHGLAGRGSFMDLRQAGPVINANDAALMAYARGMLYWHRQHRFCGRCGSRTRSRDGGHMRQCTNPECNHPTFPRTDPAVIMLVENRPGPGEEPKCLLGRHAKWAEGQYSTLAGFVEPGETLEEAVAREVFEEVGVIVDGVEYRASQPWPFPSSIMLGFWSTAVTTEINVDEEEIQHADWFTADELGTFGNWGDPEAERKLPRKDSISRYLIETWIERVSS